MILIKIIVVEIKKSNIILILRLSFKNFDLLLKNIIDIIFINIALKKNETIFDLINKRRKRENMTNF